MERERYIGVSGTQLKADIYIALGISGQIQHMVGAADCGVILAVNKDKNAPIFKDADAGIVGDLYKIVPELTRAFLSGAEFTAKGHPPRGARDPTCNP